MRGRKEGRRCAEGERARTLNGNMINRRQMKKNEEMSVSGYACCSKGTPPSAGTSMKH